MIITPTGKKHTEETKAKMRAAKLGKKLSAEHCLSLSRAMRRIGNRPPSPKDKKWSLERREAASKYWKANPSTGMRGKHHTPESKEKIASKQRGSKSHLWRGGTSAENKIIRRSWEYRQWREAVFQRDGYTCQECGLHSGNGKRVELHPDHIKPFSLFPEYRFDLDNGKTLCIDCHRGTDSYGYKVLNKERSHYATI